MLLFFLLFLFDKVFLHSALNKACSSSSAFSLVSSESWSSSSAFSRKYSSSSSYFSLDSSTRRASSSAFRCALCCCSSDFCLASRARQTPYYIFNCVHLYFSAFYLASSERCASLSAFRWACSPSSDLILVYSTRRASYSSSRRAYYSSSSSGFSLASLTWCDSSLAYRRARSFSYYAIRLASRAMLTPYSTFSRTRLCSSGLVMGIDACVSWKCRVLWHLLNWHNCSSNPT